MYPLLIPGTFGSAQYGDVLADSWNVYSFGPCNLDGFLSSLQGCPPNTLGWCYRQAGLTCAPDSVGFHQMSPISGSVGRVIHVCQADGSWVMIEHIHVSCIAARGTISSAGKWPLLVDRCILPSAGQRPLMLGDHSCFAEENAPR